MNVKGVSYNYDSPVSAAAPTQVPGMAYFNPNRFN